MRTREEGDQYVETVTELARELCAPRTVSETLNLLTQRAVETLDGCDYAGILLVRPGRRVETVAATSEVVRESNHAQAELREGPCFDAAREGTHYRIIDMRTEKRWPRYAPRAREIGIGATMGIRLFAEPDSLAALNIYSAEPYQLTTASEQLAWVFGSHAAVAIASSRSGDELGIDKT